MRIQNSCPSARSQLNLTARVWCVHPRKRAGWTASPWCVIRGGPHLGDVFLDPARQPCLLDRQLIQRGMWYVDVGYHIGATLSVSDRRLSERDLLVHYLDCWRPAVFDRRPSSKRGT